MAYIIQIEEPKQLECCYKQKSDSILRYAWIYKKKIQSTQGSERKYSIHIKDICNITHLARIYCYTLYYWVVTYIFDQFKKSPTDSESTWNSTLAACFRRPTSLWDHGFVASGDDDARRMIHESRSLKLKEGTT